MNWYNILTKLAQNDGAIANLANAIHVYIDSMVESGSGSSEQYNSLVVRPSQIIKDTLITAITKWIEDIKPQLIDPGEDIFRQPIKIDNSITQISDISAVMDAYTFADMSLLEIKMINQKNNFYEIATFFVPYANTYIIDGREDLNIAIPYKINNIIDEFIAAKLSSSMQNISSSFYKIYQKFLDKWIIPYISSDYYPPHPTNPGEKRVPHGNESFKWHLTHKQFLPEVLWQLIEKYKLNQVNYSSLAYKSQQTRAPYRYDRTKGITDFIRFPTMRNDWLNNNMLSNNNRLDLIHLVSDAMKL